jgi:hypothetical protein
MPVFPLDGFTCRRDKTPQRASLVACCAPANDDILFYSKQIFKREVNVRECRVELLIPSSGLCRNGLCILIEEFERLSL